MSTLEQGGKDITVSKARTPEGKPENRIIGVGLHVTDEWQPMIPQTPVALNEEDTQILLTWLARRRVRPAVALEGA